MFHALGNSIPNVISYYKDRFNDDRFNTNKVDLLFHDDPNYELLHSIAEDGAMIDVDPIFKINPDGDEEFHSNFAETITKMLWATGC